MREEAPRNGMADILSAMRMGTSYRFPLIVREFRVDARPLTIAETVTMTNGVVAQLNKLPEANRTDVYQAALVAKETLVLACKHSPQDAVGQLSHMVLDEFTPDELLTLYAQYRDGCDLVNPSLEQLPISELLELVALVKKSPEALTRLSRPHLVQVARSLLTTND